MICLLGNNLTILKNLRKLRLFPIDKENQEKKIRRKGIAEKKVVLEKDDVTEKKIIQRIL